MKNSIIFLITLFGFFFLTQSCDKDEDINFPEYPEFPQDKLQFNRTVFIEFDTTVSCSGCTFQYSETITVETNKTLKIESINLHNSLSAGLYFNNCPINTLVYPIWLPTGNYEMTFDRTCSGGCDGQVTVILSAIEYDIIP